MNDEFDKELSDAVGQRNMEWHVERLGRFTSSKYSDLLKEGKKKGDRFGQACLKYVYQKIGEILSQQPHIVTSQAMEWGSDQEVYAAKAYEKITGSKIRPLGFVKHGEFAGGSPDGEIIDEDGIVEIKCPWNPANHIQTLLTNEVPDEYMPQVQGNLMATGRKYCDFISYDPRIVDESLQIVIIRAYRNEEMISKIRDRIEEVVVLMKELMETLK